MNNNNLNGLYQRYGRNTRFTIVASIIGLMGFLFFIQLAPFGRQFLNTLYPKPLSQAAGTDWSQDGGNAQRTGSTSEEPVEPWTYLWSFNGPDATGGLSAHFYNAPPEARTVVGGGKLFVPAGVHGIYALDLTSGSQSWNVNPVGVRFNSTPAYDSATGFVYAGAADGNLYKINANSGAVTTYNAGNPLNKSVLLVGNFAFVLTDSGELHKVNTTNMTRSWMYSAGSTVATLPSYSSSRDAIIYATDDLFVHAVNNSDGSRKWRVKPSPNTPGGNGQITQSGSPANNQFERGWPVVAERTGIVFVRQQLPHDSMLAGPNGGRFDSTNALNRTWLQANQQYKNLFALNLDDGSEKFIPAVGYGTTEDWAPGFSTAGGAYGVMGTQPVVKELPNGKEVAYIEFRNNQTVPVSDYRWSGHMGEMVLDDSTVPGLVAGDLRFIKSARHQTYTDGANTGNTYADIIDEQDPLTIAGNTLFFAHWSASNSFKITDRTDPLGLIFDNPIKTSTHPPVIRGLVSVSCRDNVTHWTGSCTNLTYVTDGGRFYNGPGWWTYWGVADPPGFNYNPAQADTGGSTGAGSSGSSGFLPRYTYVSNGYMVVEGNGGDLSVFRHSGVVVTGTPAPTVPPVPTPTPTTAPVGAVSFKVATGWNDNLTRQIIRTAADKVYLLGGLNEGSTSLKVYWTNGTGYPTVATNFNTTGATATAPAAIISADGAYDGGTIIHILVNTQGGQLVDMPFDTSTNTFKSTITITTGNPTINCAGSNPCYLGTQGVSGMFDELGTLHLAYWGPNNQILYRSYTYNSSTNALTLTSGPTRLDSSGTANHPELVVSPLDNSVVVAWTNGLAGVGTIRAKTRSAGGTWGTEETVNTSAAWTSSNNGINIDQGPSMLMTPDGKTHLIYIGDFGSCGTDYGRAHYVTKPQGSTTWTDQTISNFCSHAPSLATNSLNEIYLIGHGHPSNPSCTLMTQMCTTKLTAGSWSNPAVFANPIGTDSLDASVSTKWGVVGWNRPETLEFAFFSANNGSYSNTSLYYARLGTVSTSPTAVPPTPTPTTIGGGPPTATPTRTPTPVPPTATSVPSGNQALQFDGNDDQVNGPLYNSSTGTQTIEAWIRPTAFRSDSNGEVVLHDRFEDDTKGWILELYRDVVVNRVSVHFWIFDGTVPGGVVDGSNDIKLANSLVPLAANTWYHLAVTYDATTHLTRLFVNGRGVESTMPAMTSGFKTRIGSLGGGANPVFHTFTGQLDEVRISSNKRYLSAGEPISTTFTPPTSTFNPDANTLVLYHMDEGGGQTVSDSSGNNITLNLGTSSSAEGIDPVWVTSSVPLASGGPTLTPAPTAAPCNITSATWSTSTVTEGTNVSLNVTGDAACRGQNADFTVWEDDGITGRDPTVNKPAAAVFNTLGVATTTWTAEYQQDCPVLGVPTCDPPEYYYEVKGGTGSTVSSTGLLIVNKLAPSPTVTPTPTVIPCTLTSASWANTGPVVEGTSVGLNVTGSTQCSGRSISFLVREDDFSSTFDTTNNPPATVTFNGSGQASTNWVGEYQCDGILCVDDPPEYYFVATVSGGPTISSANGLGSTANELKVTKAVGGAGAQVLNFTNPTPASTKNTKAEWVFDLDQSYSNPYYFYDGSDTAASNPANMNWFGIDGVSVDMNLTSPSGKTIKVPAFWMDDYTRVNNGGEQLGKKDNGHWHVRFTPSEVGTYQYFVTAQDKTGTGRFPASGTQSFSVANSANKGFVRTSTQDPRFFSYDDGTPFIPIPGGRQWWENTSLKSYDYENLFNTYGANKINLVRIWDQADFSLGVEGAQPVWIREGFAQPGAALGVQIGPGNANIHGGLRSANPGPNTATQKGWYQRLVVTEPNRAHKLTAWIKTEGSGVTAQVRVTNGLGFNTGTLLGQVQVTTTPTGWTQYSTTFTPNSSTASISLLQTSASGQAYIDDLAFGPTDGSGNIIYNIVSDADIERHFAKDAVGNDPNSTPTLPRPLGNYFNQWASYELDKIVESAQTNGVEIQLCSCSGPWFTWPVDAGNVDYSQGWVLKSWERNFRYRVARWGYSPAIINWEMFNEHGNIPSNSSLYSFYQNYGTYQSANDPYKHNRTTSQGSQNFGQALWSSSAFDTANYHDYMMISRYPANLTNDEANFVYMFAWCLRQTTNAYCSGLASDNSTWTGTAKPWVWGELDVGTSTWDVGNTLTANGEGRLRFLRNSLWAGLFSPIGTTGLDWYWTAEDAATRTTKYAQRKAAANFFTGVDYDGGIFTYLMTASDKPSAYSGETISASDPKARVYGMRRSDKKAAYLWVQHRDNTWFNSPTVPNAISPTVTIGNLLNTDSYKVEIWNTLTGTVTSTSNQTPSGGSLAIAVGSLNSDVAVKIESNTGAPTSTPAPTPGPTTVPSATPAPTAVPTAAPTSIPGNNKALQFNSNPNLSVGNNTSLEGVDLGLGIPGLGNAFTVEAFVNPTSNGSTYDKIVCRQLYQQEDWCLVIDGQNVEGSYTINGDHNTRHYIASTANISANNWHHIAFTGDGSAFHLYVDGNQQSVRCYDGTTLSGTQSTCPQTAAMFDSKTQVNSVTNTVAPFKVFLGRSGSDTSGYPYHGLLDEVRVSKVARYTGTTYTVPAAAFTSDSNTLALYHLNEGAGTATSDSSATANGTLIHDNASNGPTWLSSGYPFSGGGPGPTVTPTPAPCNLTSAAWSTVGPVSQGSLVSLNVVGNSSCNGQSVSFQIREDDSPLGFDNVTTTPGNATFNAGGTATASWTAEYQQDCPIAGIPVCDPPEYYFIATRGAQTVQSATNQELLVNKIGTTLGTGDVDGNGTVNAVDIRTDLSHWGEAGNNQYDQFNDNKINSLDFAHIVNLLSVAPTPTVAPPTPTGTAPTPTPGATTNEWSQFGHDAQRSSFTSQSVATPWKYKWQWNGAGADGKKQAGHLSVPDFVQPITGGGRVYMVAANSVYALNSTSGSVLWTRGGIGTLSGTPVYDSEDLYVGSSDGHVYKLDATDGSITTSFTGTGSFNLSLSMAGNNIFAVSSNGNLYAINKNSMAQTWQYVGGSTGSTPASYSTSRNAVIYLTQDLFVHAVNVSDGTRKWRVKPTTRTYQAGTPGATGAQAEEGWPVIAEQHGVLFIRYRLDWDTLWTWNPYPTTNAQIRANLQSNPGVQPLFALNLDTGATAFIPAVGNGGAGDGGTLPMGTQPVIRNLGGGQEVAYIIWRNGLTCAASFCDGREDATMGEMVLDNTTVSGYAAGDVRFVRNPDIQTDEMMNITMSNDTVFHSHWLINSAEKVTDRTAGRGATFVNPITTTDSPFVIWRQVYCPASNSQCNPQNFPGGTGFSYGPANCPFDAVHRYCSAGLYSYGDQRSYAPGFYEYHNDSNSGTTPFTVVSNNLVMIKTNDGAIIALDNGNPLAGAAPVVAQVPNTQVLGATAPALISYPEAKKYLGQNVVVEGVIASAVDHLPKALYLGFKDPHDGALLVRIFAKDRSRFSYDPLSLKGKKIRVHGFVTLYWPEGKDPEIVVTDPSQIEILK